MAGTAKWRWLGGLRRVRAAGVPHPRGARYTAVVAVGLVLLPASAEAAGRPIYTLGPLSDEERPLPGDEGLATATAFESWVVAGWGGGHLVSNGHSIRFVDAKGRITTVAGMCTEDLDWGVCEALPSGDGGPALAAPLSLVTDIAATSDGGYLVADAGRNVVRRVDRTGTITTVAGNGAGSYSGDGGPAAAAGLPSPGALAVMPDGGFLVASGGRVRRVSADGGIRTVAGTGRRGFAGDGGPATKASIGYVAGMAVMRDGGILIAAGEHKRVRRIAPSGRITTIAGGGTGRIGGGGALATRVKLSEAGDVAALPHGGFLIADKHFVRRVSPSGRISTFAGSGREAFLISTLFNGDGRAATRARLDPVQSLAVLPRGDVLISGDSVRLVPAPRTSRLAVAITGTLNGRRPGVTYSVTRPARLELELFVGDRPVARRTMVVLSGRGALRLPLLEPTGPALFRLRAVAKDGSIAVVRQGVVLAPRLTVSLARKVLDDDWVRCTSIGRWRVDCLKRWSEGDEDEFEFCRIEEVRLGAGTGLLQTRWRGCPPARWAEALEPPSDFAY